MTVQLYRRRRILGVRPAGNTSAVDCLCFDSSLMAVLSFSPPPSFSVAHHRHCLLLIRAASVPSNIIAKAGGGNSAKLLNSSPERYSFNPPPGGKSINPNAPTFIKPFIVSEWVPVLKGWACSCIGVACLSKLVPLTGKLSASFAAAGTREWVLQGAGVGALLLVRSLAYYLQQAFLWEAALNVTYKVRVYGFRRVLQRDMEFFEGNGGVPSGDIAYRIAAESADLGNSIYVTLQTTVPNILQLFAMARQMLVISPSFSVATTLVIPCLVFVIAYFGKQLRRISRKAHVTAARLSAYLNEVLCSMILVKVNNAEVSEGMRFERLAEDDLKEHLKKKKMKAAIPLGTQFMYLGGLSLFFAGSLLASSGLFDGSRMVSFVTTLFLLVEPIQGVGKAYNEMKQAEPAIERLIDLTTFLPQVAEKGSAITLSSAVGDIKFRDVSFRYGESSPLVLNNLNLHIKPGEKVAFVGPSGGGKTTVIKLLLRLYDPVLGHVFLDDCDIKKIKLDSLRKHIALVPQDLTLFAGTITQNIGYRDLMREIDMGRVLHAARVANADEFIRTLSDGYDTNIGQHGSLLSGGQKQRLAIARAIYQNSSILILDEASSALDGKSELLVRQAIEQSMHNRTVLVIAHRLETILMADRILLLEDGHLEEVPRSSFLSQYRQFATVYGK